MEFRSRCVFVCWKGSPVKWEGRGNEERDGGIGEGKRQGKGQSKRGNEYKLRD